MQNAEAIADYVASLPAEQAVALAYDWSLRGRPQQQLPPGDWYIAHYNGGRGSGKTETGAQSCRHKIVNEGVKTLALIGPTLRDVRQYMVEGTSGILSVFPPGEREKNRFIPSKREIHFFNGAIAYLYTSEQPENIRGFNGEFSWCDEMGSWIKAKESWDNLQFAMRVGKPQIIVTTTPRVTQMMKWLWHEAHIVNGQRIEGKEDRGVIRITLKTLDNAANLDPRFVRRLQSMYGGTRLARQELEAELLEDVVGAIFYQDVIDRHRPEQGDRSVEMLRRNYAKECDRIVVALDPANTFGETSDLHGVVVIGRRDERDKRESIRHAYVLDDLSLKSKIEDAALTAIKAYHQWNADKIVVEVNQGGDWVEMVLKNIDANIPVKQVRASRGKITRAEPIASLYAEGRVHHVGRFEALETEMTTYVPGSGIKSPDRLDALVWGMTELFDVGNRQPRIWTA